LPLTALALSVVVAMAAFAVDIGYWRYQQRLLQSAADSAAMAGGIELDYSTTLANVTAAAKKDAATNGFTDNGGVNVSVAVNNPPASGAYAGSASAVEVIITEKQPQFFSGIFGGGARTVAARAVSAENSVGRGCVYALSPSGTALTINGTTVNIPTCGVYVNGNLTVNGSTVTAHSIGYAGSDNINGSTFPQSAPQQSLPAADPCATVPGCAYLAANPPVPGTCLNPTFNGHPASIPAGTYCSTLQINGASSVTFAPGLYILEQGMTINGSSNISGAGVTFYNLGGTMTGLNGSSGTLTAPSSGNYAGILMYQVPSDTNGFVENGSAGSMAGALYFPGGQLTLNGGLSSWLLAIGSTVVINGSGLSVTSSAFPGLGHFVLAE
jgi:Flp pilus assembly protein TadG